MKNFIYFSICLFFTLPLLSCNSGRETSSTTRRNERTNNNNYTNNNNNNNYTNNTSRSNQTSRDLFSVQCSCHSGVTAIPVYGQGFTRENAINDARKDCQSISSDYVVLPNACTVQIFFIDN